MLTEYKSQIILFQILVILISISKIYSARIIILIFDYLFIATIARECLENVCYVYYFAIVFVYTYIVLTFYIYSRRDLEISEQNYRSKIIKIAFYVSFVVYLFVSIVDGLLESKQLVMQGAKWIMKAIWTAIIVVISIGAFYLLRISKILLVNSVYVEVRRKILMFIGMLIFCLISLLTFTLLSENVGNLYAKIFFYFSYLLIADILPLASIMIYIYRLKNDLNFDDITDEIFYIRNSEEFPMHIINIEDKL
ncbi:hypothetical protein SteCoe_28714 [Stentor coeruleus]|uniref:Uncharacterized protein n=1 Tax=Stentor coeruleus TaxID=5963 RepID=A0A1R2B7P3_9CILI|nr:hypothetical protein SteCoe_28714 [Stentor coeruleus]